MAQPYNSDSAPGCSFGYPNPPLFSREDNYPCLIRNTCPYSSADACREDVMHPDDALGHVQLPRDTSDSRFAIWGMPVRPQVSHFPPNHAQACYPCDNAYAAWMG